MSLEMCTGGGKCHGTKMQKLLAMGLKDEDDPYSPTAVSCHSRISLRLWGCMGHLLSWVPSQVICLSICSCRTNGRVLPLPPFIYRLTFLHTFAAKILINPSPFISVTYCTDNTIYYRDEQSTEWIDYLESLQL